MTSLLSKATTTKASSLCANGPNLILQTKTELEATGALTNRTARCISKLARARNLSLSDQHSRDSIIHKCGELIMHLHKDVQVPYASPLYKVLITLLTHGYTPSSSARFSKPNALISLKTEIATLSPNSEFFELEFTLDKYFKTELIRDIIRLCLSDLRFNNTALSGLFEGFKHEIQAWLSKKLLYKQDMVRQSLKLLNANLSEEFIILIASSFEPLGYSIDHVKWCVSRILLVASGHIPPTESQDDDEQIRIGLNITLGPVGSQVFDKLGEDLLRHLLSKVPITNAPSILSILDQYIKPSHTKPFLRDVINLLPESNEEDIKALLLLT
jgi:hypothetical protein